MIELLEIALSGFWEFVGTAILVLGFPAIVLDGIAQIVKTLRK